MINILGIRHHGPGSARSVLRALDTLMPDMILIEGPPDASNGLLRLALHPQMRPPVALLIYRPDEPRIAAYYPFAEFSPEWQALGFALRQDIPVRFMDLAQANWLALPREFEPDSSTLGPDAQSPDPGSAAAADPLHLLAQAAGFSDGERWWERLVERRQDAADLFGGILELMTAARAENEKAQPAERETLLREASMRQAIRSADREGFHRIAVVCGAWHAPALVAPSNTSDDANLLSGLAQVAVAATWVPWTYERLAYWSGYGAGIASPGYYHHLWTAPNRVTTRWMIRVAQLLREQDLAASPAAVIEAVRLAEALAALRASGLPGLPELNEAVKAVFCFGDDLPMQLILQKLIVGDKIGQVPDETPLLPFQQDLLRQQKRLRLVPEASQRSLDLDLRKPTSLDRSHLLHRLNLLGIQWGKLDRVGGAKGTFHELWQLQWQPEMAIASIEANRWGNTILDAATDKVRSVAEHAKGLHELSGLIEQALLADLPDAIASAMVQLDNLAAVTSDIPLLMDALPPLANVLRYGNVRQTDAQMVDQVVEGLVTRICIGLPAACASLNDDAAEEMYERLLRTHNALLLVGSNGKTSLLEDWLQTLARLCDQWGLHGLVAGRCCRVLLDRKLLPAEDAERRMNLALSTANEPTQSAAWIEGFLRGSGLLLLHNRGLWGILDAWMMSLGQPSFIQILPLLRRTFSTFPAPERREMGERARYDPTESGEMPNGLKPDIDVERAKLILPIVAHLLGIQDPEA